MFEFFPVRIYLLIGNFALRQVLNMIRVLLLLLIRVRFNYNRGIFSRWIGVDINFGTPLFGFDLSDGFLLNCRYYEGVLVYLLRFLLLGLLLLGLVPPLFS
jgi:hypothetical protein